MHQSEQQVAESRELKLIVRSTMHENACAANTNISKRQKSPQAHRKKSRIRNHIPAECGNHHHSYYVKGSHEKTGKGPPWCTSGPEKECRTGKKGLSEGVSAYVSFLRATRRTSFFILFSSSSWMSFCVCAWVRGVFVNGRRRSDPEEKNKISTGGEQPNAKGGRR